MISGQRGATQLAQDSPKILAHILPIGPAFQGEQYLTLTELFRQIQQNLGYVGYAGG